MAAQVIATATVDVVSRRGSYSMFRRVASWLATTFLVLAVGAAIAAGVALLVGFRPMAVLTGSMRPAIEPGDVVIVKQVPASEIRVGDVAAFKSPDPRLKGAIITHRVRSVAIAHGRVAVVTRGDANTRSERWTVRPNGTVGRVGAEVPAVGRVLHWMGGKEHRLPIILVAAAVFASVALWRIWFRAPRRSRGTVKPSQLGRKVLEHESHIVRRGAP
jgi:signal peptidase I